MLNWVEHEKKFYNLGACFLEKKYEEYFNMSSAENFIQSAKP